MTTMWRVHFSNLLLLLTKKEKIPYLQSSMREKKKTYLDLLVLKMKVLVKKELEKEKSKSFFYKVRNLKNDYIILV